MINDLLDAIDSSLRGKRVFSDRDETAALAWQEHQNAQRGPLLSDHDYLDQLHERAAQLDIKPAADATADDILAEIHEREGIMAEGEAAPGHADHIEAEADALLARSLPEDQDAIPFFGDARFATEREAAPEPGAARPLPTQGRRTQPTAGRGQGFEGRRP